MNAENFIKFHKLIRTYGIAKEVAPEFLTDPHNPTAYDNVMEILDKAHVFELTETQKKLLALTEPSKDIEDLHLPFETVFLDVAFTIDDIEITGLLARGGMLLNADSKTPVRPDLLLTVCYNNGVTTGWETMSVDYLKQTFLDQPNSKLKHEVKDFLYKFFLSFLNFLNNPEVEYVINQRSEKNIARRRAKGQAVISSSSQIRVSGKVKEYLDKVESSGSIQFNNSFWVRGHHRRLKSDRYKIKKSIWIFPFIKGTGELKEKIYVVGQ